MTPFDRLIRRVLAGWEAHQRAKRFRRMISVNPQLRAAHEALERDRQRHAPTRQDIRAKQAAVHAMLRRHAHG